MENEKHIEKLIAETMDSLDGVARAKPRPFLLTRINARFNKQSESRWENAGSFIARPAVIIAGLCMIIGLNLMVVVYNNSTTPAVAVTDQLSNTTDEFSSSVATLDYIENIEPQ